jgi:allophanate hydrolase
MKSETTQFATFHYAGSDSQFSDLASYQAAYAAGVDPVQVLNELYGRIDQCIDSPVWISVLPRDKALEMLAAAQRRKEGGAELPLFGIPFAVKDNIDVAGLPTTAGCPEFSYAPKRHAFVVEQLIAAGAIPIGKTNLDQFATGLNGTRTPHGIPRCVFNEKYISGGSSSGSAVAVASGLVPFSLGTDTAGSGRVPASFNNLVGLKPTKGLFSNSGVVPAVRSQDCISVFARNIDDALTVSRIAAAYDAEDAYSRQAPVTTLSEKEWPPRFTFGVPTAEHLQFFGDKDAEAIFKAAIQRLEDMGGTCIPFDYAPFKQAAELLYAGPWIAERLAAIETFANEHADAVNPVVRNIICSAKNISAVEAFKGAYCLAELTRIAEATWQHIDVMLLPTAPTIYTVEEMLADPVRLNSNLGLYTNFVNLMDLSAIAVPAGFRPNGLPFGVTLIGRAFEDGAIASLGKAFVEQGEVSALVDKSSLSKENTIAIAVVGAHLSGQPLNHQLIDRNGRLKATMRTAPGYALYALNESTPAKPGLIRNANAAGNIEVEIWELPVTGFGSFVSEIPAPLGIGTITLEDGSLVKGFLCEPYALETATDITHFGGWRAYWATRAAQ